MKSKKYWAIVTIQKLTPMEIFTTKKSAKKKLDSIMWQEEFTIKRVRVEVIDEN